MSRGAVALGSVLAVAMAATPGCGLVIDVFLDRPPSGQDGGALPEPDAAETDAESVDAPSDGRPRRDAINGTDGPFARMDRQPLDGYVDPDLDAAVDSADAAPDSESDAHPDSESDAHPDSESDAHPDSESDADPDPDPDSNPPDSGADAASNGDASADASDDGSSEGSPRFPFDADEGDADPDDGDSPAADALLDDGSGHGYLDSG